VAGANRRLKQPRHCGSDPGCGCVCRPEPERRRARRWFCPRLGRAAATTEALAHVDSVRCGQYPALLRLAGERRTIILVLSYCGLRWGELAALKVGRVDTMRRRITVAESVTEVAGTLTWGTPKAHQQRSVPIPRFLIDELDLIKAGKGPTDLLFTGTRGGVMRNVNFRREVFDDAAVAVGLKGLTPHELRHMAASLAVSSGANLKAVQRMLGHASAAMTLDVYSGLFDDDLDGLADRMDEAHVYSLCTTPEAESVAPKSNVSQIRSATTESA